MSDLILVVSLSVIIANVFAQLVINFEAWFEKDTRQLLLNCYPKGSGAWRLLPVVSWLYSDHRTIFIMVEGLTLLVAGVFYLFSDSLVNSYLILLYGVFVPALISLALIDVKWFYLPDRIVMTMLWLTLLAASLDIIDVTADQAIQRIVVSYVALWLISKAVQLWKNQESMGYGDIKLLTLAGALFGHDAILVAMTAGIIMVIHVVLKGSNRQEMHAFGPYIAVSMIAIMIAKVISGGAQWLG